MIEPATPKVLISDKLDQKAEQVFRDRGVAFDVRTGLGEAELTAIIGGYDGLAVRSSTKVTADLLAAADNLKVVGRAGIGVDNIDVSAATQRGVVVMNTPFGNATTTAEHAIGLMFALARQIPAADRSTQTGQWEKSRFLGVELARKTLGLIGCGNVGSIVAERAIGLKLKVLAYDPYLSDERAEQLGVQKADLADLLARSDFISLHAPLNDDTRGIIDADALAMTKPGMRLINCARGGLVDESALLAAMETGHVAGVALDVFNVEPPGDSPLFGRDNVVVTPHLGASTTEAQENVAVDVAQQMSDFLLTGAVVNALNMPSLSAEEAPLLKPYMKLADQLGSFAGQLTETGLRAVKVEYLGQVAALSTRPLTAVVLQGLLTPLLETVNMVSAPVIARERNIQVTEVRSEAASAYQTMMRLTVTTEQRERSVAGTIFNADRPRLVEVAGVPIEAELGPNMLFLRNEDKPGLIGALGSTLGDAGVNIATFHLGRSEKGGNAMALIEVDEPLPEEVLVRVRGLPHVVQAKALRF